MSNKHSEKDSAEEKEVQNASEEAPEIVDVVEDNETTANITEDEADGMLQKINELTEALEKEKKDYLFLRADFDNYRKRMLREREDLLKNAAEKVLKGILPIVDDFERGLKAAETSENAEAVRQGMELIYQKLIKFLADNGVTPIDSDGKEFDADFHEAIASIPAPTEELKGKVVDTTTRGYMLNDKVLRHAKVAVGE